jgi:predicted HAD superfamily Cof-like phosphohydrolase
MDTKLRSFFEKNRGVASVSELAEELELDEGTVRRWARANEVRRIGSTFVFDLRRAKDLVDDLLPETDDDGADEADDDADEADDGADEADDGADEADDGADFKRRILVQLGELLTENARLKEQVTELQTRGSELVLERQQNNLRHNVTQLHRHFGLPARETPTELSLEEIKFRSSLLVEEVLEALEASGVPIDGELRRHLAKAIEATDAETFDLPSYIHELGDIDYVNEGTRVSCGVQGLPIMRAIAQANAAKSSGGFLSTSGKIVKPVGWVPPDIKAELTKQGWRRFANRRRNDKRSG